MDYRYYIGEGPEAEAFIAEVLDKNKSVILARTALRDEYNADALILGGWNNDKIVGLGFKEKQIISFLKGERHMKDGGYAYFPKLNCKAGKELAAKMANSALTFSVSSYIIKTLGISRKVIGRHTLSHTGMAMYSTTAGISYGKLLVKIPKGSQIDNKDYHRIEDPMPAVSTWLREVKESEWLAAQGK